MRITIENGSKTPQEMSVVDPNLNEENEVKTMTTSTAVAPSSTIAAPSRDAMLSAFATHGSGSAKPIRSSAHYTGSERFVANVGLALLRWSNRRAGHAQPTHARMALLLENERVRASQNPARPMGVR